ITKLKDVDRLGLWVDRSARRARTSFVNEVRGTQLASDENGLLWLAHRRNRLLRLASDSQQDGHTLSILREAEKDARRASLPFSRERVLLEVWNACLGYGERIGRPLLAGGFL